MYKLTWWKKASSVGPVADALLLGKITVAVVSTSLTNNDTYNVNLLLPGCRSLSNMPYETAKKEAVIIVKAWIRDAGLDE